MERAGAEAEEPLRQIGHGRGDGPSSLRPGREQDDGREVGTVPSGIAGQQRQADDSGMGAYEEVGENP